MEKAGDPVIVLAEGQLDCFVSSSLEGDFGPAAVKTIVRSVVKKRYDRRGSRLYEKLRVETQSGERLQFFLKYCPTRPSGDVVEASPEREVRAHTDFLADAPLGTPRLYGVCRTSEERHVAMLFEFVGGKRLKSFEDKGTWLGTAAWLGDMHQYFGPREGQNEERAPLPRYDEQFYWSWAHNAALAAARVSVKAGRQMDQVLSRYDRVAEPLGAASPTLVHGEFYCTNILVSHTQERQRICPIDWETAALGCGALDLAYLARRAMGIGLAAFIDAYVEGWQRAGGSPISVDLLRDQVRRARIHELLCALWLGTNHRGARRESTERKVERALALLDSL